ncbi:3-ketoacyl-ACP reductase [Rhizobium sp. BK251]|uniref:3-ketoacyl-ACP reductase n=1 Tax=Rhizobium sp. BK251 TaxID=2512125 RepID=UPI00104C855D|nr:3-ketoacyl-ACP reductase [Rhizobium sp. BK251]TCL67266.1 NAD(P)-dependent dehydrogenase (short-subunit alcohol dehydrogenase family) [Rhizobium sp. BK251]
MSARPVAIVTGGRKGIGLGIASALAASGFDLALTGVGDMDPSDTVLDGLRAVGGRAIYLKADISDLAGHQSTVDTVLSSLGSIDCLVNNAGIASVVRGDFLDLQPENFDTIIDVNLKGTVFFTQTVVRAMLAAKKAATPRSVINITSVSAELSSPERLDYCISKAGLAAFSRGLALRLAETGIGVFEVRPGIIRTDMTAKVSAKYDALIADGLVPMKRWGEASDIGTIVAALASGSFAFATGSVIDADGGLAIPRL